MKHLFFLLLSFAATINIYSQDKPIGFWRSHTPYTDVRGIATDGVSIYVVTKESFYSYNAAADEIHAYSKVDGMSDVGMSAVAYDATTDVVVLAYENTNIDLFIDETFYNIPDIKLKSFNSLKQVNHIFTEDGLAYLCMSIGIVVLDLSKKEIKETYTFSVDNQNLSVSNFIAYKNYYYTTTSKGLYRVLKTEPNKQNFAKWELIDERDNLKYLSISNGKLNVATADAAFSLDNDTLSFFYKSPYEITNLITIKDEPYIAEYILATYSGRIKMFNDNNDIVDSFNTKGKPLNIITLSSGEALYVADDFNGLAKYQHKSEVNIYRPNGPSGYGCFDILAHNKKVWLAHGGYNVTWGYTYNQQGVSKFENDQWTIYNFRNQPTLNNTIDFIRLAQDPVSHAIYAGSYGKGLFRWNTDGSIENITDDSPLFEATVGDPNSYRISGLAFDQEGNLWMNQYGAPHDLLVRTKEGAYYNFTGAAAATASASVIIDDYNQKWYISPGLGLAVYDDNYTIANPSDDRFARINQHNNLPNNNTNCIVKDKDGAIWIGTENGIGIINCPGDFLNGGCEVEQRIVQYDEFAGYLFQGESVMSIAVDGANRKWVGTNNGVWLISESGDEIIHRFTSDNSPLPSDNIQTIAVDPVTGDVYIGTVLGLISYRSAAIEGKDTHENVLSFPNPVPSGYEGTIAIKGLSNNADVRITDIAGQLVYKTKALGGQAVWNGKDYTGRRPQSGVYLIFSTNNDGSQTYAGKLVFME